MYAGSDIQLGIYIKKGPQSQNNGIAMFRTFLTRYTKAATVCTCKLAAILVKLISLKSLEGEWSSECP